MNEAPKPVKVRPVRFMLRALQHRNYRLFFSGQVISLTGTWITNIATSWLVYRLTGSVFLLGAVGFATQLPAFLVSPFAGLLVDQYDRRRLLLVTQTLSMIQSLALALLTFLNWISVSWLLALCVFQGVINALDMPCRQAFASDVIEKKEDLPNAIALNSSVFNAARLVGPAIGGILIAALGEAWCFLIDGLSYLAVIAALANIRLPARMPAPTGTVRTGRLDQMKEGVRYVAGFRPILVILGLISLMSMMSVPYTALMPAFANHVLGGGPHTLGFLMSAIGAGALTGALWLASRKSVLGLGRIIALGGLCFGAGLIAFSLSRWLPASILCLYAAGWGFMVQMAACNTILQTVVENDKRGRVMSLYIMAFMGATPVGSLLAGAVSHAIGVPLTVGISGAFCLLGALWFRKQLPSIRSAIRPIYRALGILPPEVHP